MGIVLEDGSGVAIDWVTADGPLEVDQRRSLLRVRLDVGQEAVQESEDHQHMLIYSLLLFMKIMFRNSIQGGDEVLLSMSKISSDDILESLYKLRIRESAQLKTVLELCDMEIHQKISMPNYQKLKTMVKRSMDQKLRLRNFDARHGRIETGAVIKNRKEMSGVEGGKGTCYRWKEK